MALRFWVLVAWPLNYLGKFLVLVSVLLISRGTLSTARAATTILKSRTKPHPDIPMIPDSHWLWGHLFWFLRTGYLVKQADLAKWSDEYGRCSVWLGPWVRSIHLTSVSDACQLLRRHTVRHSPPVVRRHSEMLGGRRNLLLLNGKEWKLYQSAVQNAIHRLFSDQQLQDTTADQSSASVSIPEKLKPISLRLQFITVDTTNQMVDALIRQLTSSKTTGQEDVDNGNNNNLPTTMATNIEHLMKIVTMDIFGKVAFSYDFGSCERLQLSSFAHAFDLMEREVLSRIHCHWWQLLWPPHWFYYIPTRRNRQFLQNRQWIRQFLHSMIQNRRKFMSSSSNNSDVRNADILDKLLEVHQEYLDSNKTNNQKNISDEVQSPDDDLVDVILTILMAGHETVSTCLTYAVLLIHQPENKHWIDLCLEEIQQSALVGWEENRSVLQPIRLPLCRAIIQESLRLYPVATGSGRTLTKPLILENETANKSVQKKLVTSSSYTRNTDNVRSIGNCNKRVVIPAGYHVGVSFWLIHRSAQYFDRPLHFAPDRWVKQQHTLSPWEERNNAPHYAFFAFSHGGRRCPGQEFALDEATLVFAILLSRLKFDVSLDLNRLEIEWKGIVQKPLGGVPATVARR